MNEAAKFFAALGAAVFTMCLVIGIPAYILIGLECNGYERATGKQTKYVVGICYIQDGGQWFAWEEYKNRFVAGGMLFPGK
jgi:hypothetical protein